jgi:hypothetical protein
LPLLTLTYTKAKRQLPTSIHQVFEGVKRLEKEKWKSTIKKQGQRKRKNVATVNYEEW